MNYVLAIIADGGRAFVDIDKEHGRNKLISNSLYNLMYYLKLLNSLTAKDGRDRPIFKSLTPKSVPAWTKNSRLEGFWLAKHKDANIPTMMEPFSPPAAWLWWTSVHHPREPTRKGLDEAVVEGF